MKFCWSTLILLLWGVILMAQSQKPRQLLQFDNTFEEEVFEQLAAGDTNFLALLVSACGEADSADYQSYSQRLDEVFQSLDSARLQRKKPSRQIERIFSRVHDDLLQKYEFENQFSEIFSTGYYNCVSATCVYSYMLGRMGIDHGIVEEPGHVYVVAILEGESWVMESTDPSQGYYELSDKLREEQLDNLVEQKMLSVEQRQSPKLDSILEALFPSEAIDLVELVSLQYLNQALYDLEDENYTGAMQHGLKAYLLKPEGKRKELLYQVLASWLEQASLSDSLYLTALSVYAGMDTSELHLQGIWNNYLYRGNQLLKDEISLAEFMGISDTLRAGLADSSLLRDEIITYSLLFQSQNHLKEMEAVPAYQLAMAGLRRDTANKECWQLTLASLAQIAMQQLWSYEASLDTVKMVEQVTPDITTDARWNVLHAELLLRLVAQKLDLNEIREIAVLRNELEALLDDPQRNAKIDAHMLGAVYARMALKDYNRSKATARATLQKGLSYAPNSSELLRYKKMMGL